MRITRRFPPGGPPGRGRAATGWTLMGLVAVGCGGAGETGMTGPGPSDPVPVARVDLGADSVDLVTDESRPLTVELRDGDGGLLVGSTVAWSSSDPDVAVVSDGGSVRGVGIGRARVWATAEGVSDTAHVAVGRPFASVATGVIHACGVTTDGAAYCWGRNDAGELGNGATGGLSRVPEAVAGGLAFSSVGTGYLHTCGLRVQGGVYCWGENDDGRLGVAGGDLPAPGTPVAGSDAYALLAVGAGYTSCALDGAGAGECWPASGPDPVPLGGGLALEDLDVGGVYVRPIHACGLTSTGSVHCWRDSISQTPDSLAGGLAFQSVSVGSHHACGVTTDGAAYCWGRNNAGELGVGPGVDATAEPLEVEGGITFASVSAGSNRTCGITPDGSAYCWGNNAAGALGDGTQTGRWTPSAVAGDLTFRSISASPAIDNGAGFTCGVTDVGAVYCWGDGRHGTLGIASEDGATCLLQSSFTPELCRLEPTRIRHPM